MRPCSGDVPVRVKISAGELRELKKLTGAMAESFGLDRRIDAYQGKRPLQLYRWDLDCLVMVLEDAVREAEATPRRRPPGTRALKSLHDRLHVLWEKAYEESSQPPNRHP